MAWLPQQAPRWTASPYVPLAGVVEASTTAESVLDVRVSDGESTCRVPIDASPTMHHIVPVLGLKPGRDYVLTVTATAAGQTVESRLQIRTPELPGDFPSCRLIHSDPESMEPGLTLCTILRWEDNAASVDTGWFIAVDALGDVVWYLRMPEPAGAIRQLPNGNFVFLHGAMPTGLREIDPLGNLVRQYRAVGTGILAADDEVGVDVESFHHALLPLPNGHFLVPTTEVRRIDEYPVSELRLGKRGPANVVGDVIAEVRPDGSLVGRWPLLDILDPTRVCYGSLDSFWNLRMYPFVFGGTKDWSHCNSVAYDERDDALVLCLRHQDCVVKIDRKTQRVQWILGDPTGWKGPVAKKVLRPEGELEWPYHAHGVKFDSATCRVLLFDNGNCRAIPPKKPQVVSSCWSRAVEFEVNEESGSVRQIWSFGGRDSNRFFSAFVGDADWMPATGNVLITDGGRLETRTGAQVGEPPGAVQWGRVLEVTRNDPAETVFELEFSEQGKRNRFGSSVYRSERIRSLYPNYD